ncbi:MAG: ADP-ribosylation factor-like protein [Candidatus Odinarchaeota archaeon]
MLRQVYILLNDELLYQKSYAKGIDASFFTKVYSKVKKDAFSIKGCEIGLFEFFESRISYIIDKDLKLIFLLIIGFSDDFESIKPHLIGLKKRFLSTFSQNIRNKNISIETEEIDPIIDAIQRKFKAKISIVGSSGVGKTTINSLIKAEEVPVEHIPTITGKVATVKLEETNLYLWDFAGQDDYDYLWENFMKGSDVILVMTDSSPDNIDKSKKFIDIASKVAPYSRIAIIANKQDLPNRMKIEDIEKRMGQKTYAMIGIDPSNRVKIIRIIADLLNINPHISPLLKPMLERELLIHKAQNALDQGNLKDAVQFFDKTSKVCYEIGDQGQAIEFKSKADKLCIFVN